MRIGTEDHTSACCKHLPCILVYDSHMRRNIYTAVFLRTGKTEKMIVLIYGPAHGAQRIMTVCQHIGNRKSGKSRCPCSLYYAYKSYIMTCKLIKFDIKLLIITRSVMRMKYVPCYSALCSFFPCDRFPGLFLKFTLIRYKPGAVYKISTSVVKLYHLCILLFLQVV